MITHDEASATLGEIDATMARTARGLGYRAASPHLLIWGVVWMLGYGLSALMPTLSMAWPVLVLAGTVASGVAGARTGGVKHGGWKFLASVCVATGFFLALFAILPPLDHRQIGVLFPLLVAALYSGVGIWTGQTKLWLTGLMVGMSALAACFLLPSWFDAVMAGVGGGALVLGGLWMRTW